jgi:hypothetical protein
MLTLRELLVGRVLFACDNHTLIRDFGMTEEDVEELSDVDLFELYEDVMGVNPIMGSL